LLNFFLLALLYVALGLPDTLCQVTAPSESKCNMLLNVKVIFPASVIPKCQ